jgi:hypothetical protein
LENEGLRDALELAQQKTAVALALAGTGRHAMDADDSTAAPTMEPVTLPSEANASANDVLKRPIRSGSA